MPLRSRSLPRTLLLAWPLLLTVPALAACGSDDDDHGGLTQPPAGPTPPTNLVAQATSATAARLTFNAVTGATSYVVQRAAGATGGTFAQVGTSTTPTFEDTGLNPGQAYQYRVAAVVGGQTSDFTAPIALTALQAGRARATIASDITANRTFYADTVYTLSGFVKVANGATLTIQPGTRIEGDFNTVGSSLFILRGARINAVGTPENPIVFTSSRPAGQRQPGDWGGLVLVGNGIVNRSAPVILEGTGTGASNPQVDYAGGTNNADNSGTLQYVRVEFAGYATAPDAELNSFTFAAVGSGTRLGYLQSMAGLDDSFEFFGGAADADHLVSYESGDDHFDLSEGYVGRMQYLIAYQSRVLVPRSGAGNVSQDPQGIENDGCSGANCTNGQTSQPYNIPMLANFTLVGTGTGTGVDATAGGIGVMLRRGTGGYYVNGVVARWPRAALSVRDQATQDRITAGDLQLRNVLLAQNGTLFQATSGSTIQFTVDTTANAVSASQSTAASLFSALPTGSPANAAALDWTPAASSPAATGGLATFTGALATKAGTAILGTAYRGAAAPGGAKWWASWTNYAAN
ncbi:MAG: fibronectin type III domain-containing protein [Gemmatirosa sp.]